MRDTQTPLFDGDGEGPDKEGPDEEGRKEPKLLDRLSDAIKSRHYSRSTEKTYRFWVKRFIFFHKLRHPETMAEKEVNEFLTHLAVKEKVSASTQTQALSAILFLYRQLFKRELGKLDGLVRARKLCPVFDRSCPALTGVCRGGPVAIRCKPSSCPCRRAPCAF